MTQNAFPPGMTLLDYFAGQALETINSIAYTGFDAVARDAYNIAEAMLRERERRNAETKGGVAAVFGKWPGTETDEEVNKALEEMG